MSPHRLFFSKKRLLHVILVDESPSIVFTPQDYPSLCRIIQAYGSEAAEARVKNSFNSDQ